MINASDIQFYTPKFDGAADGEALTDFAVEGGSTTTKLVSSTLTQADGFFADCIVLMSTGEYAHIDDSTQTGTFLTLYRPLSVAPTGTFQIIPLSSVAEGVYRSSDRIYGLTSTSLMAGIDSSYLPHINGIGTGAVKWTQAAAEMQFKAPGDSVYGAAVEITGDGVFVVYGAQDVTGGLDRYIELTITLASLPGIDTETPITVTRAESALLPSTEADQSSVGIVRYVLIPIKNNSATDATRLFNAVAVARADAATTMDGAWNGSDSSLTLTDATGFPSASFWVYNSTKSDCAYIKYRSGNDLYPEARAGTLRGLSGVPWVDADAIEVWSDVDVALAEPTADVYPADFSTLTYAGSEGNINIGIVAIGGITGVVIRETVTDKVYPLDDLLSQVSFGWV